MTPGGETLVFSDEFTEFDLSKWKHEITLSGGGNWEFEYYYNNRSNSFVKNGSLYLKPTLTAERLGEAALTSETMDLWGGAPSSLCTQNQFYGCSRTGNGANILNPIQSARIRTAETFNFKYGRVEVRAQLPRGDWLWPAIWLLPRHAQYGDWPASGEIDIMESRGNDATYPASAGGGVNTFGSTLHWGPHWPLDPYEMTHETYTLPKGTLADDYHIYGLSWNETQLFTYIDTPDNVVLSVPFNESFWQKGGWDKSTYDNPWEGRGNSAPFDREFYLVMNVAVGGTSGYFPDGVGGKPWSDTSNAAANQFWAGKGQWETTWKGEDVAMKVDYVRVWQ